MSDDFRPQRDNLVRAISLGGEVRDAPDGKPILYGYLARFNEPTVIRSSIEGNFVERIAPGAFAKTIRERKPKVLFNHGKDPDVGEKVIGSVRSLTEDAQGVAYEVELFDGLPPMIMAGLRAGAYGTSFRMSAIKDRWATAARSDANPEGLQERTLTEVAMPEFGPVSFPAYANATAAMRSLTDEYTIDRLTADPERLASILEATQGNALPAEPSSDTPTPESRGDQPAPSIATISQENPVTDSLKLHPVEQEARLSELEGALRTQAEANQGIFSIEEQARWDADTAEVVELRAAKAQRATRAAFLGTIAEQTNRTEYSAPTVIRTRGDDIYDMGQYGPGQVRSIEDRTQKLRDNAMRSLEASSFAQSTVDQERAKEGVQNLLDNHDTRDQALANRILLTGSPQYKRAFAESLEVMRASSILESTRAAALAVVGTTTTGGYMLPYTFDPTFIKTGAWTAVNPFRSICRVQQIVGSNAWEGVSVGAVPAIYETEALAVTEAGPTFARPAMTAQRASSFVSISYETLQDRPDVLAEISDLIQEGKDTLEENQYCIGVGSTVYPLGMFVKSTFTVKETITDNTFAVADLDATEAALPIRHRPSAVWGFSRAVIRIIEGWETAYGKYFNSTLGYPAVGNTPNNPGGNTGKTLLGYPVYEFPSAPVTVTGDDTIVGILVNPNYYMILDRVGMNVELVQNLVDGDGKPTGQRGILALWRNTARALAADAGRQVNIN